MEKVTQGHPMTQSPDFVKENIEILKSLFPTIVKEGKIDLEELQAVLGNEVETEEEYYRLTWAGKSLARKEANKPSTATLRPDKADSKDWDTTQNIFIEGENLEVLKLLQKSYANKIKMIYIDPPYNTGSDFVYKDNYADNLSNYLAMTGQLDEEGKRTSTNTESDGRFHSNWLNMMYPRLKLARNLLADDGVIFASIDDNEVHNFRKLFDEVFGEENFIDIFNWSKTETPANLSKKSKKVIEYILCYQKTKNDLKFTGIKKETQSSNGLLNQSNKLGVLTFPANTVQTNIPDGIIYKGMYGTDSYDVELLNDTEVKNNLFVKPVTLSAKFKWGQTNLNNEINNGTIIKIPTIKFSPSYEKLEYDAEVPPNLINSKVGVGTNENAGIDLTNLMGKKVFDFPKPTSLIKYLLKFNDTPTAIILDFFAGSCTLAQAIMELNYNDFGNRRFVCIQLPEKIEMLSGDKEEEKKIKQNAINLLSELNRPSNIAEISKERIRRSGFKIIQNINDNITTLKSSINGNLLKNEILEKIENLEIIKNNLDTGFKVFKLDSSNIHSWDGNPEKLQANLFNAGSNIKENRSEEDVLFEILLKNGLDLAQPIEQKVFAGKNVFNIGLGTLFICLADGVTTDVAEGIGKWKLELEPATCKVIFKDNGFTDVEKTNSMQILKRYGIEEVNTI